MNSSWHLYISFTKSFARIVGGVVALIQSDWTVLALGIIVAEFLGILEEVGDDR